MYMQLPRRIKRVPNPKPLPSRWKSINVVKPAVWVGDILTTNSSRLSLKLLVFNTLKDLRRFYRWLKPGMEIGNCKGCCIRLETEIIDFKDGVRERNYLRCDPRYYAVMCLLRQHLTTNIIVHEAVHAGIALAERSTKVWDRSGNWEEQLCYPTGRIAANIVHALRQDGLID